MDTNLCAVDARPAARRAAPALFAPAARRCLQRARAVAQDGRLVVTCAAHGHVFAPTPSGWRLTEFFADTP